MGPITEKSMLALVYEDEGVNKEKETSVIGPVKGSFIIT
jgi:hypothetical protein